MLKKKVQKSICTISLVSIIGPSMYYFIYLAEKQPI